MTFICKFTQADIDAILSAYEDGADRQALCARFGISVRTLFRWQAKAGRSGPVLRQIVAQLRDENRRLRQTAGSQAPAKPQRLG
jgi:transposase-like protein